MTDNCRVLIVDDNKDLQLMLAYILKQEGFTCLKDARNCKEALLALEEWKPDFIILDIMLPDGDGFSLMETIRRRSDVPVLFLSAKDEDEDRLMGLGLGADDYLTKPFLPKELLLRMKSILKRTYARPMGGPPKADLLTLGARTVDFSKACVISPSGNSKGDTTETALTAKELALLKKLADNRGNIVTFDALSQALWGDSYYGYENSLMVHVRRLREKIEDAPSRPEWLITARGLGYKLSKERNCL